MAGPIHDSRSRVVLFTETVNKKTLHTKNQQRQKRQIPTSAHTTFCLVTGRCFQLFSKIFFDLEEIFEAACAKIIFLILEKGWESKISKTPNSKNWNVLRLRSGLTIWYLPFDYAQDLKLDFLHSFIPDRPV